MNLLINNMKESYMTYTIRKQPKNCLGIFLNFYPKKYHKRLNAFQQRKEIILLRQKLK